MTGEHDNTGVRVLTRERVAELTGYAAANHWAHPAESVISKLTDGYHLATPLSSEDGRQAVRLHLRVAGRHGHLETRLEVGEADWQRLPLRDSLLER